MRNYILGAVLGGGISMLIGKAGAIHNGRAVPWSLYFKIPYFGAWTYLLIGSVLGIIVMIIIQNLKKKN
ncbi:MAG: hypothetical protein HOJ87_03160 [Rhodospirillaceae bacterium]|jgi:hypothetical protein|nr:hypothetical protein [Rhodospirillaceae bacterium]